MCVVHYKRNRTVVCTFTPPFLVNSFQQSLNRYIFKIYVIHETMVTKNANLAMFCDKLMIVYFTRNVK